MWGVSMNPNVRLLRLPRLCNEPIDGFMTGRKGHDDGCGREKLEELFDVLQIDHRTITTCAIRRGGVAKMFVEEVLHGRIPSRRRSPNSNVRQLNVVTDRSRCARCARIH